MKILYVEDDQTSRLMLQDMLRTAGVIMTGAPDGATGLARAAEGGFDMILLDLRMPDMSGLTALRHIRAREEPGRCVPIIVVSAEMSDGAREMCRAAGANGFVDKPVDMKRLFEVIGSVASQASNVVFV